MHVGATSDDSVRVSVVCKRHFFGLLVSSTAYHEHDHILRLLAEVESLQGGELLGRQFTLQCKLDGVAHCGLMRQKQILNLVHTEETLGLGT